MMSKGYTKSRTYSHQWVNQLRKILPMISVLSSGSSEVPYKAFEELVDHLLKHRGEAGTLQDLKAYRLYLQQLILKQKVTTIPFRKVGHDGHPKVLKPWIPLALGSIANQRECLSLWRCIEMFKRKPSHDTSSITDPFNGSFKLITEICDWIGKWDGLKLLPDLQEPGILLSNKAGPNGMATASAFDDLSALHQDQRLLETIAPFLRERANIDILSYPVNPGAFKHSKIVFLSDKAGKTRQIAIGDWWSNVSLSTFHKAFMLGLRRFDSDVTYRQNEIPKLIKGLGTKLYSSDMTAFTDRFPREIEVAIVKARYGEKLGDIWSTILTDREFNLPNGEKIRYSVGNPMGLLSSWPVSTFAHHAVKQYCAWKVHGYTKKRYKYLVLGDDCCDSSEKVYEEYLNTITDLGVQISRSKCTESKQSYAEFAKRLFTPQGEVTGIPIHLLEGIRKMPEQFIELLRIMRTRGFPDDVITPGLWTILQTFPLKERKVIQFVLSAPESMLGMPPVITPVGNYKFIDPPLLHGGFTEAFLDTFITLARKEVFWEQVDLLKQRIDNPMLQKPKLVSPVFIPEYHPMLAKIGDLLMVYLQDETNEYSVYDRWMSGQDYELALVPSLDQYRYSNRAHRATRAKYEILRKTRAFATGELKPRTIYPDKISNFELFQLGFPS